MFKKLFERFEQRLEQSYQPIDGVCIDDLKGGLLIVFKGNIIKISSRVKINALDTTVGYEFYMSRFEVEGLRELIVQDYNDNGRFKNTRLYRYLSTFYYEEAIKKYYDSYKVTVWYSDRQRKLFNKAINQLRFPLCTIKLNKEASVMTEQQRKAIELIKDLSIEEVGRAMKNKGGNKLIDGDTVWYVDEEGNIDYFTYRNIHDSDNVKNTINFSEVYRTNKEIKLKQEYNQVRMRIINRIRELNDGWVADFENTSLKYYVYKHIGTIAFSTSTTIQYMPKNMYLKTEDAAFQLIEEMSDDLKFYFDYQNNNWLEL